MRTGLLTGIDYAVIVVYLLGMVGLGFWMSKRQKTSKDYFLAGRRMGWVVLAPSVLISMLSANSMLGVPGYSYSYDLQYLPIYPMIVIPIALIVIYAILPVLYALSLTTAYTYLEYRFSLGVRLLGSSLFILLRGGWLASAIFAPSLALAAVISIPGFTEAQEIMLAVLVVGIVATLYTTMGGIEADIWSDFIQFFVFAGAMLLIWFYILRDVGGWSEVWRIGSETGHTFPLSTTSEFKSWIFNPNLKVTVELTFLWLFIRQSLGQLKDAGTDQITLQRYFSGSSIKQAIRSIWAGWVGFAPLGVVLPLTGLGLVAYFRLYGSQHPALPTHADQVLPYFVAAVLPAGISGLFIASLFAATMSSVDSGINSLSAASVTDFYRRLRGTEGTESSCRAFDKFVAGVLAVVIMGIAVAIVLTIPPLNRVVSQGGAASGVAIATVLIIALIVGLWVYARLTLPLIRRTFARIAPENGDEAHYLRVARYGTVAWGLIATAAGLFLGRLGQIYRIAVILMGFWEGPLLGIFLLGLFTRRANATGVITGAIAGLISTVIWWRLGFTVFLYGFVGLVPTLVVGYLVSLATARPTAEQIEGMTTYTRFPIEEQD